MTCAWIFTCLIHRCVLHPSIRLRTTVYWLHSRTSVSTSQWWHSRIHGLEACWYGLMYRNNWCTVAVSHSISNHAASNHVHTELLGTLDVISFSCCADYERPVQFRHFIHRPKSIIEYGHRRVHIWYKLNPKCTRDARQQDGVPQHEWHFQRLLGRQAISSRKVNVICTSSSIRVDTDSVQ